jgi:glutathione S-transferase
LGVLEFREGLRSDSFRARDEATLRLGPVRQDLVDAGLREFATSATILEKHLSATDWLIGNQVTYADFRVACVLPFADIAGLPLA